LFRTSRKQVWIDYGERMLNQFMSDARNGLCSFDEQKQEPGQRKRYICLNNCESDEVKERFNFKDMKVKDLYDPLEVNRNHVAEILLTIFVFTEGTLCVNETRSTPRSLSRAQHDHVVQDEQHANASVPTSISWTSVWMSSVHLVWSRSSRQHSGNVYDYIVPAFEQEVRRNWHCFWVEKSPTILTTRYSMRNAEICTINKTSHKNTTDCNKMWPAACQFCIENIVESFVSQKNNS